MGIISTAVFLTIGTVSISAFLFFLHAMFENGFAISEALKTGGYNLLFLLFYGQALVQLFLTALGFKYFQNAKFTVFILAVLVSSLLVFGFYFSSFLDILVLYRPTIDPHGVGEGFVLICAAIFAWTIYNLPRLASNKSKQQGPSAGTR